MRGANIMSVLRPLNTWLFTRVPPTVIGTGQASACVRASEQIVPAWLRVPDRRRSPGCGSWSASRSRLPESLRNRGFLPRRAHSASAIPRRPGRGGSDDLGRSRSTTPHVRVCPDAY